MKTNPSRLTSVTFHHATAILWIALLFVSIPARAAVPEFMTYQGYLVDANGNALAPSTPANYPVIFRIYSAATGGVRLWSEQQIVTVDKGNFSVVLGEGTPLGGEARPALSTVLANTSPADRFMSIAVTIGSTTSEMLPRLRLLPAPYAFTATSANQIVNPAGAPVLSYANSRLEVAGNIFASGVLSGNGSGLTGLTASQIPPLSATSITSGTILDTLLSTNVARRNAANAFTGNQTISGNVGIGTPGVAFPLTIGNNQLGDKISLYGQSGNSYGFGIQPGVLQIHTDQAGSDITFGSGSSAAMAEVMRIKGNGNVGIGTNNPGARLDVNGGINAGGTVNVGGVINANSGTRIAGANALELGAGVAGKEGSAGKLGYGMFTANTLDIVGAGTTANNRKMKFWAEGGSEFRGRVGIGTATPRVPLDVLGNVNYTLLANQPGDLSIDLLDAFGLNNQGSSLLRPFSILAEQHVGAVGFVASSDRRIKTDITTSSKERDLAAIQQLRVAEYGLKDTILNGTSRRKGFIAQEVETIIPEAVSQSVSFIPDVFALATNLSYSASTKALTLGLAKPHGLRVGEQVRLHLDGDRRDLKVTRLLSDFEFVVDGCEQSPAKAFVYGRQVNDFRTIDYDHIFTVGVGAIQELARKVQELEVSRTQTAELEKAAARAATIDRENAELRAKLDQQDKRLVALERLMQQRSDGVQQAGFRPVNIPDQR